MGANSFNLQRFVEAQNPLYDRVLAELQRGEKRSHWMWFIFPQLKGLGHSSMAEHYGIASRAEAEAYLKHDVLGPRLVECTKLVNAVEGKTIEQIFGYPDDLKFRSSMTLFAAVSEVGSVFQKTLEKYFGGESDPVTAEKLR